MSGKYTVQHINPHPNTPSRWLTAQMPTYQTQGEQNLKGGWLFLLEFRHRRWNSTHQLTQEFNSLTKHTHTDTQVVRAFRSQHVCHSLPHMACATTAVGQLSLMGRGSVADTFPFLFSHCHLWIIPLASQVCFRVPPCFLSHNEIVTFVSSMAYWASDFISCLK